MSEINVSRRVVKGYPFFLIYRDNYKGVVFVLHGLTGKDSDGFQSAYKLANAGYLVVLPLAKWHGEQKPDNYLQLFNGENFIDSITSVMNDYILRVKIILDYLFDHNHVNELKIGCVGFSMGAYVTYLMPLFDKRIKTIIPISGSPFNYDQNAVKHFNISNTTPPKGAKLQAADHIDSYKDLNILIIHNKDDETVSSMGSEKFYKSLKPKVNNGEVKMILNQVGGHKYYSFMDKEVISWFDKHL